MISSDVGDNFFSCISPVYLSISHFNLLLLSLRKKAIPHTVKKGSRVFRPQPGCHYQTFPGQELWRHNWIIPAQGEFGSDIPAGDGKLVNLFLRCRVCTLLCTLHIVIRLPSCTVLPDESFYSEVRIEGVNLILLRCALLDCCVHREKDDVWCTK
jgi:hypothetical protein